MTPLSSKADVKRGCGLTALTPEQRLAAQKKSAETRRLRRESAATGVCKVKMNIAQAVMASFLPRGNPLREEAKKAFVRMTPMQSIKAMCLSCSNVQKKEIVLCTVDSCPIYPKRTGKRSGVKSIKKTDHVTDKTCQTSEDFDI